MLLTYNHDDHDPLPYLMELLGMWYFQNSATTLEPFQEMKLKVSKCIENLLFNPANALEVTFLFSNEIQLSLLERHKPHV